jgi:hypothetical protein
MDINGELIAVDLSGKEYAINRLLTIVEYINDYDVKINEIISTITNIPVTNDPTLSKYDSKK